MNFLSELRRRNVIRMAGLYLVGAWLVIQVAQTLLPIFGTPDWVSKTLVVLLAIGFVPALVFAWLYELTPEGLKRDADIAPSDSIAPATGRRMDRLIFAGLLALIAVIAADRYWPREPVVAQEPGSESFSAPAVAQEAEAAPAENDSDPGSQAVNGIAVLPFVNMSADADNAFFSDGISEELLNVLVRVDGLDVASRTSSFAYKGRELGARQIAQELRVSYVLEGSVRKSGNKVRITAQLIDAVQDRHLWSETYDRDLTDIFVIQDEIANAIVSALRTELADATAPLAAVKVQADTDNLPAYESYLKGRELFIARSDMAESIRLFERATELDPKFARGWEGLAAAYSVADSWGLYDRDYTDLSVKASHHALELDDSLSMPWAALGMAVGNGTADYPLALQHLDKAIAVDPNNATAHLWRGIIWLNLGFFERALADMDACLALDPAYPNCTRWKSVVMLQFDRDQAMKLFEAGVAKGFVGNRGIDFLPLMHARGDRIGVRLAMKEAGLSPELAERMMQALDRPPTTTLELSDEDLKAVGVLGDRSVIQLWLGDYEGLEAFTGKVSMDAILPWQLIRLEWRNTPSYKRMINRIGVGKYWREHGFPPQCRPLAGDDFECDVPKPL